MGTVTEAAEPADFQRALKRAVYLPLASLFVMALVLVGLVLSLVRTQHWVDHTDEVIGLATRVEREHLDLAAGYRGYLLTGDFAYPGVFELKQGELERDLRVLADAVTDNPEQTRAALAIRDRAREWVGYAAAGLKDLHRGDAILRVRDGTGDRFSSRVRLAVDRFIGGEQQLRASRVQSAYSSAVWAIGGIVGLTLIVGALLGFVGRNVLYSLSDTYRRRARDLEVTRRDLENAHSELERRVADRTRELVAANRELRVTGTIFQNIYDYAIFMLDPEGRIVTWTAGAERVEGYAASEVMGKHFSIFYTEPDIARDHPANELRMALSTGRYEEEGWRIRKGGDRIWANVIITPLFDEDRTHLGFVKIVRDVTDRRRADENLQAAFAKLEQANHEAEERGIALAASNQELEAFCYSVSHDLRSPLRGIDGFSQVLVNQYGDRLDEKGRGYLDRVRAATQRMGQLIDDLLKLSRVTRTEMGRETVDLSAIAHRIVNELATASPARQVDVRIREGLVVEGDPVLLGAVLENLLGNAWKFTSIKADSRIELDVTERDGQRVFLIRDNGAGFNMAYSDKLFGAFQRLHKTTEFPGTGIGLASVRRILRRHGGDIWAEAEVNRGATFYFTLGHAGAVEASTAA